MNAKVFILGRPGSGKSTAARHLNAHFRRLGWSIRHVNDYDILQRMFLADTEHKIFRPTANNGFDAIDLSVLDLALFDVEQSVEEATHATDLVTIEFARDDYRSALQQFSPDFIQDAFFLFMDADLETCLTRVHDRVARAAGTDDHPSFSDDIFRRYYAADNKPYIQHAMQREFALRKHIQVINNTGPLQVCLRQIEHFANLVYGDAVLRSQKKQIPPVMMLADCAD
jgi:adenylate kinase family enzyme